jgi:hypothetical protein
LFVSRNDALGFAQRTRKNLAYIKLACDDGEDVHVVTQLVNSLLGLVVFFRERHLLEFAASMPLANLEKKGWPHVTITMGAEECSTLKDFVSHLRNAVAHGRIRFSSESRDLQQVRIMFEDWKMKAKAPYVCFEMNAPELQELCLQLVKLVEEEIG